MVIANDGGYEAKDNCELDTPRQTNNQNASPNRTQRAYQMYRLILVSLLDPPSQENHY